MIAARRPTVVLLNVVTWALVFAISFPLIWMVVTPRFRPEADLFTIPPSIIPRHITFEYYAKLLWETPFPSYLNSIILATSTTALVRRYNTLLTVPCAFPIPGARPWRDWCCSPICCRRWFREVEILVPQQHAGQRRSCWPRRARTGSGSFVVLWARGRSSFDVLHLLAQLLDLDAQFKPLLGERGVVRLRAQRVRLAAEFLRQKVCSLADRAAFREQRERRDNMGLQLDRGLADVGLSGRSGSPLDGAVFRRSRRGGAHQRRDRLGEPCAHRLGLARRIVVGGLRWLRDGVDPLAR